MPDPLLATKVSWPRLRAPYVPRPALLKRLNAGLAEHRLLTLVSAPPGYGKTTTLRIWLGAIDRPVAWVRLEPGDNDLPQFLKYVLAALQQIDDNLGRTARELVESAPDVQPAHVASLLVNDLHALEQPLVLVLEDYHVVDNPQIDALVDLLLRQAIPTLHLVITTREDPGLALAHLRVQNQLTEIRAADLCFSLAEAVEFYTKVMPIPLTAEQIAALAQRTEGWVAGLQLAALSLRDSPDPDALISAFRGTHRHVLDYLLEEVLNRQPEEVRSFLRQTAILDRLSAPLCEAVSGQQDSHRLLRYLERSNLFLVPLDDHRTWYRYHALFAELLRNQLLQSEPERWDALQTRAADWYLAHGYVHQAVEHAFQAADRTLVLRVLEERAFPMLFAGEVTPLAAWFDRVPDAALQSSPMLCIGKAWALVLIQRGARRGEVEPALQAAQQALARGPAGAALRDLVAGHMASIRAFLLRSPALTGADPAQLIALSQEAQRRLPEQERAIRSVNDLNIGYACLALADLPAAERAYRQALADGLAGGNLYAAIFGPINLVMCALLAGRLHDALQLCETYLAQFSQTLAGRNFPPIGALGILKGAILLETNRVAEAEPVLREGLDLIRWTGEYEAPCTGYTALARLHAVRGDRPAMLAAVSALEEAWPEGLFYTEALRLRLSLRAWPTDPSVQQDAPIWLARSGIDFANLAVIHSVDPMSMAWLARYLSAAHIVARLVKVHPGAYPLAGVQAYLARQQAFAAAHAFVGPLVEIALARSLLHAAAGQPADALAALHTALKAAAPTGFFRIFVDEGEPLRPLLQALKPRLSAAAEIAYADRLLAALGDGSAGPAPGDLPAALLSEREREVLRGLAAGLTYEEVGRQLFLSLNTVQFHVKNIYGKLLVNKRVQAIQKARELQLI